ncbi:MAG: glycosyl transferase [Campylobacterota bacterium]|nr:glycosyl transferase [Campylobacterota bacterium]
MFTKYIKAVGTGKKHNYDLSVDQMYTATKMMLEGEVYPEQISAFLLGWRLKPETPDEFVGALKAFDEYIIKTPVQNSVELGYPYDGKRNNPYLFSLIAQQLLEHEINIVVSGDTLQAGKDGITLKEICNNIQTPSNLYYFDRKVMFKELSNLTQTRSRLGIRTGFNTIERLPNPANSDIALLGVFHKPFMEKYAKMFGSRYKKLIIVKGNEGTSEIYSKCQYWIIENDSISEHTIDPKDFGIDYTKSWDRISLEESIQNINNPSDELVKIAKLNAAFILFAYGKCASIQEAYESL